jgi:acyl-CoA reductase-like NAD-dependent aldehyde dehydrogenase
LREIGHETRSDTRFPVTYDLVDAGQTAAQRASGLRFDEAISLLNEVEYGLTSSLFSNDLGVVQRFIDESQNGMLHINHGTIPDSHMPFGGIKNSGVGAYSVGPSAANFYTTEHSVYVKA